MKIRALAFAASLLASSALCTTVVAQAGSQTSPTRSTTSTFSRPTPSPSFQSKPSIQQPSPRTTDTGKTAPSSFSRPQSTQPSTTITPQSNSLLDKSIPQRSSKNSLTQFDNEQKQYKAAPVAPPPSTESARSSNVWQNYGTNWRSSDDYWTARRRAEATQPPPPSWVTNNSSSYGGYAAAFLGGMMLDNIMRPGYAEFAYSHANDPDFMHWRADMDKQAQDNTDLKAKLAALDNKVNTLREQNAPKTNNLPQGVDPALVVSPSTAIAATASEGHGVIFWVFIIIGALVTVVIIVGFIASRQTK